MTKLPLIRALPILVIAPLSLYSRANLRDISGVTYQRALLGRRSNFRKFKRRHRHHEAFSEAATSRKSGRVTGSN